MSRWETGSLVPRPPDVFFMLELYGVDGSRRDALLRDARQARNREEGAHVAHIRGVWEIELDGTPPHAASEPSRRRTPLVR